MGAHPHDSSQGPAGGRLGADLSAHVEAIVRAAEREAQAAERAIAEHRQRAEEEVRRYLAAARLHADAEAAARAARIETLSAAARRLSDELTDAVTALGRELHADNETRSETTLPRPPWPAQAPQPEQPRTAQPAPPEPQQAQASWTRVEEPAAATTGIEEHADRAGGGEDARPAGGSRTGAHPDPTGPARHAAGGEEVEVEANGSPDAVPSAARLVAIEMAVGGASRAEVEEHLRTQHGVADPEPLLDDVFGAASHAGSRLAWGEP